MRNFKQFLLENKLIDIESTDIKIKDGIIIPNQFPNKVNHFDCSRLEQLTSLENCPQEIGGYFACDNTNITSLQFSPKIIGENYYCYDTKITSLDHAPLKCNEFTCYGNNILHLKGIGRSYLKECEIIILNDSIKSNILGLCRIKHLRRNFIQDKSFKYVSSSDLYEAIKIVNKHLKTDGSECREELIQNGFNDYAKF
jgi:hypothetical protein